MSEARRGVVAQKETIGDWLITLCAMHIGSASDDCCGPMTASILFGAAVNPSKPAKARFGSPRVSHQLITVKFLLQPSICSKTGKMVALRSLKCWTAKSACTEIPCCCPPSSKTWPFVCVFQSKMPIWIGTIVAEAEQKLGAKNNPHVKSTKKLKTQCSPWTDCPGR